MNGSSAGMAAVSDYQGGRIDMPFGNIQSERRNVHFVFVQPKTSQVYFDFLSGSAV
jgi:hypothetical protein